MPSAVVMRQIILRMLIAASLVSSTPVGATVIIWCNDEVELSLLGIPGPATSGKEQEYGRPVDCVTVTKNGDIEISRILPWVRRTCLVQRLKASSSKRTPERKERWCGESHIGSIATPVTAEITAADVAGNKVYVTSTTPSKLAVFNRDDQTGLVEFEGIREFPGKAERDDFLRLKRTELIESRQKKPQ